MGLTTFSLANVCYALRAKSEHESVFSLDTFDEHRFMLTTGMSIAAIILGTQLGLRNKILNTVGLSVHEWLIRSDSALMIVFATEVRKLIVRRRDQTAQSQPSGEPAQTMAQPST